MSQGGLPTNVALKGRTQQKKTLSFAARVANNSQKKIETLNRIDDVTLKSMYRFYDLEMIIFEGGHKKNSHLLKKQISSYQRSLHESKAQRQKTALGKTFITQPNSRHTLVPIANNHNQTVEKQPTRPKYGAFLNCEPEAIGSVRRRTKNLLTSSVSKSMSDLYRLRDKHIAEYNDAVAELHRMKNRYELPFSFDVSCRSYTPVTAHAPYSPIIVSLRNKIRYSENELRKLQHRLTELANRQFRAQTSLKAAASEVDEDEQEGEEEEENVQEKTFRIFCDRKLALDKRENTNLTSIASRPITTNLPQIKSNRTRRNSRLVKFDLQKMKSNGSISKSMLNLLASSSKDSHIEIIDNPFESESVVKLSDISLKLAILYTMLATTGRDVENSTPVFRDTMSVQTRSRLLIEAKRDDRMYIWLGFESQEQFEKAMRENPRSIKQIPAALLDKLELEEGSEYDEEPNEGDDSSDDDSADGDDDDLRFKVFDEKKMKGLHRRKAAKTAKG